MFCKFWVNLCAFCLLCSGLLVHFLVGFLLVKWRFRVINWLTLTPLSIICGYLGLIEVSVLAWRSLVGILENAMLAFLLSLFVCIVGLLLLLV